MAGSSRGGSGRDELSRLLRALRDDQPGTPTQTEIGNLAGINQRKLSRFESGLYVPDEDELTALLRVYRPDEDTAARMRQLVAERRAEPRRGRAVVRRANYAAIQHRTERLEDTANLIEAFQPTTVVGLVQTAEWIRAVYADPGVADANESVEARERRQRKVIGSGKNVIIVHTEGALRTAFGSAALMAAQCDQLATYAATPGILRVGVIPWSRPVSYQFGSGFRLFDRKVLAVSTEIGEMFPPDQADIDEAADMFDQIVEWATFGEDAAAHYTRIADDYRKL